MTDGFRFVPAGDRSVLVYLGQEIDPGLNDRVLALARALKANPHPAIVEVSSSYHCVLIEYDPLRIRLEQIQEMVQQGLTAPVEPARSRTVEIPVCYGGESGPDLENVAGHAGLSTDEVVARHTSPLYRVYCLGFSPGFPYLGGLDPAIQTPRLAEPRVKVPGGSVGIGGSQTGVYPSASPGGWQLIGRTPLRLFDPSLPAPALLEAGDQIRFVAIPPDDYAAQARQDEFRHPGHAGEVRGDGKTGIRVLQPGLLTTLQDLGRRGYMQVGVPVGGAADYLSLMVGNWLLGNRARTSALEITLSGPELEFSGPVAFCVTGAPIPAELIPAGGDSPVSLPGWTTFLAGPGDRLRLGTVTAGARSYLCVAGGFDLPPVLGSLSEDLFGKLGPLGRPLRAGDWLPTGLPLQPPAGLAGRVLPKEFIPEFTGEAVIRTVRGPHADLFDEEAVRAFFEGEYRVGANSDRQGLRLEGPQVRHNVSGILSEPIAPGSIQVPPNGQPILLMGNRQTTGGYAEIGVAVYLDLATAAQLKAGDRIRFQEIDIAEAHSAVWAERRRLAQIRRYLDREINRSPVGDQSTELARQIQQRILAERTRAVEPPVSPPATDEQPSEAPSIGARTLRIRIGAVEYEALVEELPE